jgi:sugar phosphate isomerase/epimerase
VTAAGELLATCWTTAGDAAPSREDQCSPVPLRERIEAAAAAGFTGFGVLAVDLAVAEREYGLPGISAMLADNGLVHLELEGLPDWWSAGPERVRSEKLRRFMLTAAEALGARHLKVTPDTSGTPWDAGHWASEFALLAGQATEAGARLGIEFLPWSNIPTVSDQRRTLLLGAAEVLGARAIKVAAEGGGRPVDPARFHDDFDRLATQAGDAGARVALEFMPMTNLASLQAGVNFVTAVGNPHGGLAVDTWHVHRGGTSYAELERILPAEYTVVVELDDADDQVVGTLFEDTVDRRRYCGDGCFDLTGIITALRAAGWTGPWGVEILSTEHRRLDVRKAAAHAAASARTLLETTSAPRVSRPIGLVARHVHHTPAERVGGWPSRSGHGR